MKILFDQGTPAPLRKRLIGHDVVVAYEIGWDRLINGDLLAAAETAFDALITTDQNWEYQQNLAGRRLAIVVLPTTDWRRIRRHVAIVSDAVNSLVPGAYVVLVFPRKF